MRLDHGVKESKRQKVIMAGSAKRAGVAPRKECSRCTKTALSATSDQIVSMSLRERQTLFIFRQDYVGLPERCGYTDNHTLRGSYSL